MAKGKSKSSGKVSLGGRTKARKHQAEVREARFAKRREEGKCYVYQPNPYTKGTKEWRRERAMRAAKTTTSSKTPYALTTSIFRKLQNELEKQKLADKSKAKKSA